MLSDTLIFILIAIGVIFNALGIVGILRFPDVYTRLHAETKMTTFGTIFLCLAVFLYCLLNYLSSGDGQYIDLGISTAVVLVALAFTNATGSHAIARAAYKSGQKPENAVVDRLEAKK
ncbi:cation:proton antiporter [Methanoplanus sp. FWC-SCC4]|uniref:Cation:proton antiporter n=1 Tax=Methanochimaera problematica TaxID=2609417 RepID=A0AA97FBI9_9EURY|nr:monovalent cation/H(+) antiporter subunit G [Methanoplanus sp. FWC-SCC4]WOF16370.1 cation:proton antiporter [Methanoplanus sp. FWC-SCC4]